MKKRGGSIPQHRGKGVPLPFAPKPIPLTTVSSSYAESLGRINYTGPGTTFLKGPGGKNYSCERCGSILMEGVPALQMRNAALKCNSCHAYSRLDKPSIYKHPPTTLADVPKLPPPQPAFRAHSLWATHANAKEFFGVQNDFLSHWAGLHNQRPNILYHYTSLAGLQGMVATGLVWLTDLAYLNDALEMQVAIDRIEECTKAASMGLSELGKELLRRASVSVSPTASDTGYYVACFCTDGDLLSQWRAYGAGGEGCSMGFNAKVMGVGSMVESGRFSVRRVIYEPDLQRSLVKRVIDETLKSLARIANNRSVAELDANTTLPAYSAFLSEHLREFLFTFKHETFAEENEWRLVYEFSRDENIKDLKFRGAKGFMVPYMELPLNPSKEGAPPLPLVEVVHGPTLHPKLTKKAIGLFLDRHNYDFVEVRGSNVPLRA